jgi:hypothetical protein
MLDNKTYFSAILDDRKWKLRKWKKKNLGVWVYWLISESVKNLRENWGEKNNSNNKQYDYKKVFRRNWKTLIKKGS